MNRIIKSVFCLCLCAFLLVGCSFDISGINSVVDAVKPVDLKGEIKTETFFPLDGLSAKKLDFENISFTGTKMAEIYIVPSDETKVEATYPSDMEEYGFGVYFRKGEIEISVPKQTNFVAETFQITIYANIEEIEITGSISLEMNAQNSRKIKLDVTGAANAYIYNIDADFVEADVTGAAAINLSGSADNFELELDGAGAIDAKSLIAKKAEVKICGAGSADVSVIEELLADMDGIGSLDYYGDPVLKNISGGLTDLEQVSKEIYGG